MNPPYLRTWVIGGAVALAALVLGVLLVAASGIVPLTASSGHWAVTEWLLQFGKRRSVSAHTLGMRELDLAPPWLVMKGAGHYESGCRPCHGGVDSPTPRIAAAMLPLPPHLPPRIEMWDPEELFYIVKHGIKFTGMPAWQSQERDDEVLALVAFLLAMPDMDSDVYRGLVYGDAPPDRAVVPLEDIPDADRPPEPVTESCARCHGVHGLGRGSAAFPKLAGQQRDYLLGTLQAYASGDRNSGIMEPVAAGLSGAERSVLAEYYAALPADPDAAAASDTRETPASGTEPAAEPRTPPAAPPGTYRAAVAQGERAFAPTPGTWASPTGEGDGGSSLGPPDLDRGREIAGRGLPDLGVPSCQDCHGPGTDPRNPMYPRLAGQFADYLVLQLELFKEQRRGGSAYAHIMHHVVDGLDQQQTHDVAFFYASLPAAADSVGR